jgi:hypothetical protein
MSAIERVWTNEERYLSWLTQKLAEPHAATMRSIAGSYFPETVSLSGAYREIVARTSIALYLPRRDADIQRSLHVLLEAIERAKSKRRIQPDGGSLSFGPLGRIKWILDDGLPVVVPSFVAVFKNRTLIFRDSELSRDEVFWVDYWLHKATGPQVWR